MRYLELPKLHQRYMCEARHAAPLLLVFHMFMFPFPYFCFKFTVFKVPVPSHEWHRMKTGGSPLALALRLFLCPSLLQPALREGGRGCSAPPLNSQRRNFTSVCYVFTKPILPPHAPFDLFPLLLATNCIGVCRQEDSGMGLKSSNTQIL